MCYGTERWQLTQVFNQLWHNRWEGCIERITEGLSKLDRNRQYVTSIITSDCQALCMIYIFKAYKDLTSTYSNKFYNILYLAYIWQSQHTPSEKELDPIYVYIEYSEFQLKRLIMKYKNLIPIPRNLWKKRHLMFTKLSTKSFLKRQSLATVFTYSILISASHT